MLLLALQAAVLPVTWYGPVTASFPVMFAGNPHDPAENDVHIKFIGPKGDPIDRIAYFDGQNAWKAVLVAQTPGLYVPSLYRNGVKAQVQPAEPVLEANRPIPNGYIHVDPLAKNRFRRDTGQPYYPVGFNLGWQSANALPMRDELAKMGANGVTWTRIWSSSWDGKNPWFPSGGPKPIPGQLWPPALEKWQALEDTCDAVGVGFQMVLFNHGAFSSRVNPNWPDNPWNAKNGGFLKDAGDFFTDPEAKRRTKMWLRYAVARYGASPNLVAWELFNEVEWVDARYENRWPDICAWHKEMADYLRTIDPYHHMVTTSSEQGQPDLLAPLDYIQPHVYPSNVQAAVSGFEMPRDKPGFFGEFGPGDGSAPPRPALRDGLYAGMLSNHAGTAMWWDWDKVDKLDLYAEFLTAKKILAASGLAEHPTARRMTVSVRTSGSADVSFAPGGGFVKAGRTRLNLPDDLNAKALSDVPSYLQGTNHRDLFPEPLTLSFTAGKSGDLQIKLGTVARAGAHIHVVVNGQPAAEKNYPGTDADHPGDTITASIPAGADTVQISNDGSDWVTISNIVIPNAGPQVGVQALGESDWMLMRLTRVPGASGPVEATVGGFSLADGDYDVTTFDLDTDESKTAKRHVSGFQLRSWMMAAADEVLVFQRT
jgi:hypothetical protein